jgi:F-type H+-transporting ATPase subunit b
MSGHGAPTATRLAGITARTTSITALLAAGLLSPSVALAAGGDGESSVFFYRVLNVGLLAALLYVVARKPIQAFFRDRRERIEGEVQRAAQMRQEAEERHGRLQRQLSELESDLDRIRRMGRERAENERDRILSDAQASAERIRADARIAIDHELRRARAELRQEASDLSVEIAAGLLRDQVTETDQTRLLDEFIDEVEGASSNGSGR